MALLYTDLNEFLAAYDQMERPLAVLAHQDDEVTFSGVLQRGAGRMHILWTTNGDGLYFEAGVAPHQYGPLRMKEALKSAAAIGIPPKHTACLAYSEVDIYRRLMYVTQNPEATTWLKPYFQQIIDDIRAYLFQYRPQCVFTCAYQGGNPEHDLTHYFTRLALDDYEHETGEVVPLLHVPMYEYTVLVALRFNPFYRGLRWRYQLSEKEMECKRKHYEAYPSQMDMFSKFENVLGAIGKLGVLTRGKALTAEEYLSIEEFGPVPEDWDYLVNPHAFDKANYIGDHFAWVPVSFDKSVRPIVASFPRRR
jgi:LmbE family N-acetylglucosaminyl deacetylase